MPTITQNSRTRDVAGIRRRTIVTYTGPASYVNGATIGDPVVPGDFFLGLIEDLQVPNIVFDNTGLNPRFVILETVTRGTSYRIHFQTALGTEVANAVNLSAYSFELEVEGR
jgi:hypothetical protein